MQTKTDAQLLREYAGTGSETAFGELVSRHADLVYSAALRQVIDPDSARDVVQSVFADLARKAKSLSGNIVLAGWLYRSTRFAALTFLRNERRRQNRERQAMQLLEPVREPSPDWDRLCPVLDEAMANLGDADRDALVLRFFKNEDLRAVGVALGTSEAAAQKRVSRALEKLRALLLRRGVTLSAATLATTLTGSAVQAAPTALASAISTAVVAGAGAAAASSTFNLLNLMSMTKLKAGLLSAALVVGAGTPIVVQQQSVARLRAENRELREQSRQLEQFRSQNQQVAGLRVDAEELSRLREEVAELHRLRAEVAQLRREKEDAARIQAENTRSNAQLKPLATQQTVTQNELLNACVHNMRIIAGAKDQWALEHKKGTGDVVNADELAEYCKGSVIPACPNGGRYTLNRVGETSSCSIHGALPAEVTPEELAAIQKQFNERLEVLPLVQFEDAPLSDVIATLARQANLNPLFDPEIVQRLNASLSIRLENVTPELALETILRTNNLRLVKMPGNLWKRPSEWAVWSGDVVGVTKK